MSSLSPLSFSIRQGSFSLAANRQTAYCMTDQERSSEVRTEALLLFVVLIWAANYPVAKFGIEGIDRFVFNGIRYVVAAAVLAGLFFARSSWVHVERADWPK